MYYDSENWTYLSPFLPSSVINVRLIEWVLGLVLLHIRLEELFGDVAFHLD